jgi:hypothetical protein
VRSLVVLGAVQAIVERLNPSAFESKVAEYRRAGLPGQSLPEGSRSSSHGLPAFDKADRALRMAQKRYRGHLRRAALELEAAEREQNAILIPAPRLPEEPLVFCETPGCTTPLEPGFKRGHCSTHRGKKYQELRQAEQTPLPRNTSV